ncbi:MAG TPA: RHS repeat-associated core domain-containing protein [Geobacteraceae bacterium]
MKVKTLRHLSALFFVPLFILLSFYNSATASVLSNENKAAIFAKVSMLPIPFLENKGLLAVQNSMFQSSTFGGKIFVSKNGSLTYILPKTDKESEWAIKENLVNATVSDPIGVGEVPVRINSFIGKDPSQWQKNVTAFNLIGIGTVYSGIELKLTAYGDHIEKSFHVKSGADTGNIRIKLSGVDSFTITEKGELALKTGLGIVKLPKPTAYQEENGNRRYIDVAYEVREDAYGFRVGTYDSSKELIISASFFFQFSDNIDYTKSIAIAVDGSSNIFVTGNSGPSVCPLTAGAYDSSSIGSSGLFIVKVDADLQNVPALAFLGGSGMDEGHALTVDGSGNVFIAGATNSADFPTTFDGYDTSYNGAGDAFVAKLDNNLQTFLAGTFLGGSGNDDITLMEISTGGYISVVGTTTSTDFPLIFSAPDNVSSNSARPFTVAFDPGLTTILSSQINNTSLSTNGDSGSITAPTSGSSAVAGTPGNSPAVSGAGGNSKTALFVWTPESSPSKAAQIAGPGWFMGKAGPINHELAKAYYETKQRKSANATTTTTTVAPLALTAAAPLSATSASPEITELARALRYDPKLIYDYVHNHIDYEPYFGSLKGATLTYLDGSGNDFDQASLMIALLQASGYTAQYVYGQMTIPARDTQNTPPQDLITWLGVDFNANAIGTVLASGGIPVTVYVDAQQNPVQAVVDRVWVKATINSVDYLFDPAFKSYTYTSKIDLGSAMAYNQSDFLTTALSGATVGSDYIQNVNETNLKNKLTTYSNNLVNIVRSQYPNRDVNEIIGGRNIYQTNLTQYTTTLPFSPVVTYTWDDVPSAYTGTLRIQHVGIDYSFNIPDLSGKRLTVTYAGADNHPELRQDGTLIASGTATTPGSTYGLTVTIDHPYAADGGTYADQTSTYNLKSGSTYAMVSDFGGVSDVLLQKRQQQVSTYLAQGMSNTSEAVLGETLNLMGLNWLRESLLTDRLLSSLAETVSIVQHRLGVVAQESGYYFDFRTDCSSIISKHNNSADEQAHFRALTQAASAFEHSVLEQLMGSNNPAVSTIKLLQIANATGRKVFLVTSANFATVRPQLVNYSSSDITTLQNLVNSGYTLVLPDNGQLVLNQWRGEGYAYVSSDFMGMMIAGGYYGGYSSTQGQVDVMSMINLINNNISPSIQPSITVFIGVSTDPVNMATGAFIFDHTDLSMGSGAPLGLSFSRLYNSGDSQTQRTLGYGWTHNYDIYLIPTSDGKQGLGTRQPVDAASFITALYVNLDILKIQDNITGWAVTSLTNKWATDQLTDNAITAHIGNKAMEFIKLPDGSYASPPGITTQLVKNGDGTYSLLERFGVRTDFDGSRRITQLSDADGNALSFVYSGNNLSTVRDAFSRTLTLTYNTDGLLGTVTDSTGRVVRYGYTNGDMTSYTDPESKVWGYGYNNHRITTLTNPLTITTATNIYDSLGRVMNQTVPRQGAPGTTATYNFYFSGFRNVEEDPAGHTTTYYYDDKKREYAKEDALGQKRTKQFDGQNHVILATDPRSYSTSYIYDSQHNVTKITNALLYDTNFVYDPQFHLTDINDTMLHNTHFGYNAAYHLTLSRDNLGNTFQASYNGPKGLKDTATDGRSTITTFTYDSFGNPATKTTASHPAITYVYDSIGRMISLTDQVTAQTTFEYDKRSLLKKITDPTRTNFTSFSYYDDGRLWTKTDRNNNTITYTYTPSGKPDTITYPSGSPVSFAYNQLDQLVTMQDGVGTTGYSYDTAGRLGSVTNPYNFTVSYTYDAAGNLTELTYPGSKKVIYTYDELNRLKTVKIDWLASKPVATYNYKANEADELDNIVNFNGILTTYSYDTAHRLTGITSPVASYQFTALDGNGNRTSATQTEPLALALNPSTTNYGYSGTKNRLLSAGSNSFGYDNEGELSSGYGSSYGFDYEHRLTSFSGASFSYDGMGNRLQAMRSGVTTRYIYDATGRLLAEADGSNNITRYYVYGQGLLAMVMPTDQVYCYHYNASGNTVALTDQSQAMVNKYAYDPFGNIGNQMEAVSQPFKYVGQHGVMTEPNGFYYMKARYYDPQVGRFISEDPIGFDGGSVNLSPYVQNNPLNNIDPDGLASYSDYVTWTASGADLVNSYLSLPKTPTGAAVFTVAILVDKASIGFGFAPDNEFKAKAGVTLSAVSMATALAGESWLISGLAGFALGNAINDIPIGDSTFKDVLADKIWDITHPGTPTK